ncbi:Threonine/homoserine/homoserine lactone efflux protein [Promicromonospora umidemergens]|uniref:LysE family translocator n=1 Tax=Promicromonospora umidemergens TaxID=629679 RepID=A0ABP8XMP0_9MICO|nr:LysE family translocator [Promicromonospora umidemergens]MCP2281935.1 Threonine/homoserine/homoserine lactone efflux protein [Promicromonospora umidemergens]
MTVPEAMFLFALVAIPLTLMPGLDSALVLRTAVVHGNRHGYATALGIGAGTLAWGVAAAVGATTVLAASETAYRALTLAGAAYLVWLGGQMLWSSFRPGRYDALPDEVRLSSAHVAARSPWRSFAVGAGTNLLNPKVGVFYLATIPQFLPDDVPHLLMGVLLAVEHNILGLAWLTLLINAAGLARRWLSGRAIARVTDRVTGVVLLAFGGRIGWNALTGQARVI